MTSFVKATTADVPILITLGTTTFLESHGHSASKKDIEAYIKSKFNKSAFLEALQTTESHFYILYYNQIPIGYSKMIFNFPHQNIDSKNVTKLERLYLLKEFHHLKLGLELFHFNLQVSKHHQQTGMWLYVWTENAKAISFYQKIGFKIIGSHDFKISKTHYNPNYQMLLTY